MPPTFVGASLLAKTVDQPPQMLNDIAPSRAGSLPQVLRGWTKLLRKPKNNKMR
jgi:hypothetical protein